ncbi:MAG: TonB-dependent receptor, partial [Pseudomonadales bacterium]
VVGTREAIYSIPGSAHYIDHENIRGLSYDDINRVLRRIPGVYVREEDGYGLFPNISLRGVDTSRSAKVTLMEDGVLAAPAPYSAPSAYYSPTTGRMDGLEVLKGTSQVKYGPHITGGVINYLSTPIPETATTFLRAPFGTDQDYRLHAYHGNTVDVDGGRFGYLVEAYARDTGGFKTIDSAPGFTNGGDTGFTNIEPMIKMAWEPDSQRYQRFELKLGYTDKKANETYTGLSTTDLRASPYRRYSASQFDNIDTDHVRGYLRHFISLSANVDVVTTAYFNEFARNWYKLNDIRAVTGGLSENLSLSAALAGAASGEGLSCLKGELACDLRVRANNREYSAAGIQSDLNYRFETGNARHKLNVGIRYHNDVEDRFQWQDVYSQAADGSITGVVAGVPGSQDNREAETSALALYVQDTITFGNWVIQPGVRIETLDLENRDYRPGRTNAQADLNLASGGLGVAYRLTPGLQVLGGLHFGFSPPGPGAAVSGLKEETSRGIEAGFRYTNDRGTWMVETVAFHTAFDDLIVVDNIGGTGSGDSENFGEVDAQGIEFSSTLDLARINHWGFGSEIYLTFTYTNAEQQNDAQSTNAESIFSFGAPGNEVPYIPRYQTSLGGSVDFERWGIEASASFVDETFTSASNVTVELNGVGEPDARFGLTDSYEILDISFYYRPTNHVKLFAGAHNLLDEEYMVSRQPHGPRPGIPQSLFAGIELNF